MRKKRDGGGGRGRERPETGVSEIFVDQEKVDGGN